MNRLADNGMKPGGGDLGKGGEDKAAGVHGGMGHGEVLGYEGELVVEEEVEVDDARALEWYADTVAAHGGLDGEESLQEDVGKERGFEEGGGVEEVGLVEIADGGGAVEGGGSGDAAQGGQAAEGFFEVLGRGAEGAGEIGAEGDGGSVGGGNPRVGAGTAETWGTHQSG